MSRVVNIGFDKLTPEKNRIYADVAFQIRLRNCGASKYEALRI
jgi:hypothetical protein